ncbi:MAG: hypothetical protein C5B59_07760 [Bacteroidetes bacterium]|nr:MAG: hypothetical protein C5B59_07760 [Bacteroidota bacterium]
MKKWLLVFYLCPYIALAQNIPKDSNDVFILQKKGANVRTYAPGMPLAIETIYDQWFDGVITAIRHDSIFINNIAFHYKEIKTLRRERTKLNYTADGTILIIAGGGVLLLGAVNGLYRGDAPKDWYKPASYITAAAFILGGIILIKSKYKTYPLGKKYTIHYLELNPNKNNKRPF